MLRQGRKRAVSVLVLLCICAVLALMFVGLPGFAPIVTLTKLAHLDPQEARLAMRLIKDYADDAKGAAGLFAHISVQIPEKSGGALTNGGYAFALFDQAGREVARGRRELPELPMLGTDMITTGSNLQIPIYAEAKLLKLTVSFQPPSARSRAFGVFQRIGLGDRFPTLRDSVCRVLPDEGRWRERVFEIDLPAAEN